MRTALRWIGACLGVLGLILLATPLLGLGVWLLAVTGFIAAAIAWERWRYRAILDAPPPGPDWRETAERFVDPQSDRPVRVFHNSRSGERAYVEAPLAS